VSGVHFAPDVDPSDLGYKSLAVNLSDLAAMGAAPAWITLCLTLPDTNADWLDRFAAGLTGLANCHGIDLVGGDTTRGPLSVTIQAIGRLSEQGYLRRSGARVGDSVFVTGQVGSAGLGLKILQGTYATRDAGSLGRLLRPEARVLAGLQLVGRASACIDVSDGLAGDLGHILEQSGVGATIEWECLPLSDAVRDYVASSGDWSLPLVAGDDYELCFTAPEAARLGIESSLATCGCPCTRIGRIESTLGLRVLRAQRQEALPNLGFDHFAGM
jgi:thiamine-monophosphate kinase